MRTPNLLVTAATSALVAWAVAGLGKPGTLATDAAAYEAEKTEGAADVDQARKLDDATATLKEIMAVPDERIPESLLRKAQGVVVIPGLLKAGFVVGGRHGRGVLAVRGEDGAWSRPVFVSISGASVGWQAGVQSTDVVMVFRTRRAIDGLLDGDITLGADASVAAGPVGRKASAGTNKNLEAEVLSYSRSRGLFAGISLDGSVLDIDHDANAEYYGVKQNAATLVKSRDVPTPESARKFLDVLDRYTSRRS